MSIYKDGAKNYYGQGPKKTLLPKVSRLKKKGKKKLFLEIGGHHCSNVVGLPLIPTKILCSCKVVYYK